MVNQRKNSNAITWKRGEQLEKLLKDTTKTNFKKIPTQEELEKGTISHLENNTTQVIPKPHMYIDASKSYFSSRFAKSKEEEHEEGILETFWKMQVTIPLSNAIK